MTTTSPRIAAFVHGGPGSIEAMRVRGLSREMDPGTVHGLYRDGSRSETARRWNAEVRRYQPDLLYVCNTAIPGAPLALSWKLRARLPYILDTGDTIFEMARRSGIGAGPRLPLLWLVETLAERHASAVVVRGTQHREYLLARGHHRVVLIRDGYAEQDSVTPEAVAHLRQSLGLGDRFVFGMMGSLVYSPRLKICYGWDLVEALVHLRDLPVEAVIIGDGDGRPWLEAKAQAAGVRERIRFCGRIPYRDVPVYLRLMDVALSTQTNNLPGQVRTTGKLPEYMAAGRFILASRVGEAALVLPNLMLLEYAGEVDLEYPRRLADRIRLLHTRPELRELRHSLPPMAHQLCSYEVLGKAWRDLVEDVAGERTYQRAASQS